MRPKPIIRAALGAGIAIAATAVASPARATCPSGARCVTVGTLAPETSPWGKVFKKWSKHVAKKSGGKVGLQWYFNSAQGDEGSMVAKMRSGQLDGAAVTSVGLSKIYKNILVLQSPGLFSGWNSLDRARKAMMPKFQRGLKAQGFNLVGTGDVGLARTMSKGRAIRTPADLKKMKVYKWDQDVVAPVTARTIGYTAVNSSVPSLLPALQQGRINCITVPALAATQLQWWSHLDHVNANVAGVGIGGLVFSQKTLDSLPGDVKAMLLKTGRKAGKMLTKKIRKEDKKAFRKLKSRMTLVTLSAAEKSNWKRIFKKVRKQLGQGVFPASLIAEAERYAD